MTSFINGITDYAKSLRWIFHRSVFLFALIPGLLGMVLSGIIYMLIRNYADDVGHWMWSWYTWEWGRTFIDSASIWVSGLIMAVLSLILFKYIILIVSSPFMSPLSERIESLMTNSDVGTPVSTSVMLQGLARGVRITLRNLSREIGISLLLLALSFFPFFAPITGVLLLATQAYFAGFGNMDFTMERYFIVPDAVDFVRENKFYAIGNGLVFVSLLFIPLLGAMIAVPLGAGAATIGVVERRESFVS